MWKIQKKSTDKLLEFMNELKFLIEDHCLTLEINSISVYKSDNSKIRLEIIKLALAFKNIKYLGLSGR